MWDILKTGHQPIHNEDKTIRIVFNGEIYNAWNRIGIKPFFHTEQKKFYLRIVLPKEDISIIIISNTF